MSAAEDTTDLVPVAAIVRRRPFARARTESMVRLAKRDRAHDRVEYAAELAELDASRPRTWGECEARALGTPEHPCVYFACRYSLAIDVSPRTGSIKANFPDAGPEELPATCALRVAEEGGLTLEEIGALMNLTRERVRHLERDGVAALRAPATTLGAFERHDAPAGLAAAEPAACATLADALDALEPLR